MLRVDCNNDGVLDAVVPDEGEQTSVSLAAISGVDGKRIWNRDVKLQIDRWSSESPWPLMDACGPEHDRRIVLMDLDTPMTVALRMLSVRGGTDIDQRVLQLDRDHSRSGSYLFTGNHRLRLTRIDATSEWPRYAVAYPTLPALSKANVQAWSQFGTSPDGFVDDKDRDETQSLSDGSEWLLVDTNGNGTKEYLRLSGGKLRCFSRDETVWQVDLPEAVSLDHIFEPAGHSPVAGVFNKDRSYALIDLRDGRELCSSFASEKDVHPLEIQGARTPLVQSVEDGLCLVRVTREGVLSQYVTPSVSDQSSNDVAESVPPIMSPKARTAFDPRRIVRHPSSPLWGGKSATSMFGTMATGILKALFAFLLPLIYIVHMINRRRFNLSYMMLAPLIAILALFTWRHLLDPTRMLSPDPDVREPWPLVLFGGTMMIAGGVLLVRAIRQRRYLVLGAMFTVAVCMTTAVFLLPMLGQMVVDNGKRYQLGFADVGIVLSLCLLNVVVMGTPFLFVFDWVRKRQSMLSSTPQLEPQSR